MPIAATSQSVAAVVRPLIDRPWRMMAPAPRKPMPLTTCAATREGSSLTRTWGPLCDRMSLKPNAETSVKSAAPTETTRWVRRPACRSRSSRSRPIAPPSAAATNSRRSTSGQPMVCTAASALRELTRDRLRLERSDLRDARSRQSEQLVERLAGERVALGGRLHLDEAPVAGHHDVHVRVGARVLRVVEIEERHAADDADRDGRDRIAEGPREPEAVEGPHRRDIGAADRRAARAAVGLEDVAVQPQRPLAERVEVRDRAHRAPDEPLDLDRPSLLLAARRLALHALPGRGRKEGVLRGDPAAPLATQPARDVLLDHGRAQHLRPSLRDHDRAVRVLEVVRLERDRAQLVGPTAVLAGAHAAASSSVATVTCSTSVTGSWRKRRPSSRNASGSPVVRNRYAPTRPRSFSTPLRERVSATSRAVSSAEKTSVTSRPKTRSKILRIRG